MPFPDQLQTIPPPVQPNVFALPTEFRAGDTFTFRVANGSVYPNSAGWSFTLTLRGGGSTIDINSSFDSGSFLLTVAAATTAAWVVGQYEFELYAKQGSLRTTVSAGFLEVLPNLSTQSAAVDLRSDAKKILDAITATMLGRAGDDILDSQIDNTSFRRMTPDQLQSAFSFWSAKVRSEEAKARARAGLATGRTILTRFVSPR